jgi:hypothetical protein
MPDATRISKIALLTKKQQGRVFVSGGRFNGLDEATCGNNYLVIVFFNHPKRDVD